MINNDIIRSVRYILNVNESKLIEIFKLADLTVKPEEVSAYLKREDEEGFVKCDGKVMTHFLNGLIYFKRGKDPSRPPLEFEIPTNNVALKKLRVAFELKDEDIIELLKSAGMNISKSELSALFRKEGHPNFRPCGDQFLRNFLKGLATKTRG